MKLRLEEASKFLVAVARFVIFEKEWVVFNSNVFVFLSLIEPLVWRWGSRVGVLGFWGFGVTELLSGRQTNYLYSRDMVRHEFECVFHIHGAYCLATRALCHST